jgi:hypothetical protein
MQTQDDGQGRGIFQRIADVSRVLSRESAPNTAPARAEHERLSDRPLQVTEKPRPESVRKAGMMAEDEQYIDIPAFLRRQAN